MILKERGLLNLDQPIDDYLGDSKLHAWVGHGKDATVRRVANHTPGLPLHYQFFYQDELYIPPPIGETIRRYGNLVTAPGGRFQYSNLGGYCLLSEVIARLSGKSYADFHSEEVFLPQRKEMFTGAIIAITNREITPGKRLGVARCHWVHLRKDH